VNLPCSDGLTEVYFDMIEVVSHKIDNNYSSGFMWKYTAKSVNVELLVARAMICLRLNNAGVNEIDKICYSGSW